VGASVRSSSLDLIFCRIAFIHQIFLQEEQASQALWIGSEKDRDKRPGDRLWKNNDIRIDRGETLADGFTNIIWQRQAQTKNPVLKKIKNIHAKIATQRISPNSDPRELQKDIFKQVG
jgi:hypothetical protein